MQRLPLLIAIALCVQISFSNSAKAADYTQVIELNFVFLHGAGGTTCNMQPLADSIVEQVKGYIRDYEQAHPGTKIQVNTLQRCYPNNVDIDTWAKNIADSIDKYLHDKENLILIGHSMGGKAALYAVAHNIGGLSYKTALVATINSPVKAMQSYYFQGGMSALQYYPIRWLLTNLGIYESVGFYDSSADGKWVGANKHWLAFISAESAPQSGQFDFRGIDPFPHDMDDGLIPISGQYADGADVVYYGEHSHSDFADSDGVRRSMTNEILTYIFGGNIQCSVFGKGGIVEHKANWLPLMAYWEDVTGEVLVTKGKVSHWNQSYTRWQEWEDVVGAPEGTRSSFQARRVNWLPFLTSLEESRWLSSDNIANSRVYLQTRAAPRSRVQVEWSVYQQSLLPEGYPRDRYEVTILTGTPLAGIPLASWVSNNISDSRLHISSQAEGPFRWFTAEWKVYSKERRYRELIDELLRLPL